MLNTIIPETTPDQAIEAEDTQTEVSASRDSPTEKHSMQDTTTATHKDIHRSVTYPAWPTSSPGPRATLPLPGQHPHPLRTDQMVSEHYDQARGMSYVPPLKLVVQTHRGKTYLPNTDLQEIAPTSETATQHRNLDDSNTPSPINQDILKG